MALSDNLKIRFGLAYGIIAILALGAIAFSIAGLFYPPIPPTKEFVKKSELPTLIGDTRDQIVNAAEVYLVAQGVQGGVSIVGHKILSVNVKGANATVIDRVNFISNATPGTQTTTVTVHLTKGIYTVSTASAT